MKNMYVRLAIMAVLSFISMYVLMYMMVNTFGNVYPNVNQFYMAAMMTAPMVIIEVALMSGMYKSTLANTLILIVSICVLAFSIEFIRWQTAVGDKQFLKSMIPHHASALLMCDNNRLQDQEIKDLCSRITSSQQSEIDWMKAKLSQLDK
jgi:uncharacterized protein (DUF305 family)